MREVLKDRERALENEFFHRVDERLLHELRAKLESTYTDIENVDAWVGALSEDHELGTSVGELVNILRPLRHFSTPSVIFGAPF